MQARKAERSLHALKAGVLAVSVMQFRTGRSRECGRNGQNLRSGTCQCSVQFRESNVVTLQPVRDHERISNSQPHEL